MTDLRLTLETLSYLVAAFALVFGAKQIRDANVERRIDATLNFARILFLEDATARQQAMLTRRWLEQGDALKQLQSGAAVLADPSSFTLDVIQGKGDSEDRSDLTVEVIGIVRALDQMALCVSNGLCSVELAQDLFCDYATEVTDLYDVVIEEVKVAFAESDLMKHVATFTDGCPGGAVRN